MQLSSQFCTNATYLQVLLDNWMFSDVCRIFNQFLIKISMFEILLVNFNHSEVRLKNFY